MNLTFEQVSAWFIERIWALAIRTKSGTLQADDVAQDLILAVVQHDWERRPTVCRHHKIVLPVDPSHVNIFLKHRAIDIYRNHKRKPRIEKLLLPRESCSRSDMLVVNEFAAWLKERMVTTEYQMVMQMIRPSESLHRFGTSLGGVPSDRCIANLFNVSPATVSRVRTKLREFYKEYAGDNRSGH